MIVIRYCISRANLYEDFWGDAQLNEDKNK